MPNIEQIITNRNIQFLLHFTRIENLDSILTHGLIPRNQLKRRNIKAITNDEVRLDEQPGASSLSISFPNYKMFYALRNQHEGSQWAIVVLNPQILVNYECAFCKNNAASIAVRDEELEYRSTCVAFESMFDNFEFKPTRERLGLQNNLTTSPQAEVLVFGTIATNYIYGAVFDNDEFVIDYKSRYNPEQFDFAKRTYLFSARKDFAHWRST